ncbi:MAG: nucleoside kinase [Eubacterium sp.]|nr:nucleoside kinase [Eubacterium sp.]
MGKDKTIKITVQLGDGEKTFDADRGTDLIEVAKRAGLKDMVVAKVNGRLRELAYKLNNDATVSFLSATTDIGFDLYKRSISMLMLKAARDVIGGGESDYRIEIMYSLGSGFFCKLIEGKKDIKLTDELIDAIRSRMNELVEQDVKFEKKICNTRGMREKFIERDLPAKALLLKYRRSSRLNIYELDGYEDYYYGYMVPSTGCLKAFDLVRHDDGFVLVIPKKGTMELPSPYKVEKKLYEAMSGAENWGNQIGINYVGQLNDAIVAGRTNDLILIQEAIMEKQIADIAAEIVKNDKRIVLIAGPSSSGKTTFSNRLSVQLRTMGKKPHPIAMDNFFKEREETPRGEDGNYDFECIGAMDLELFNGTMTKLLNGEEADMPVFDFINGKKIFGKNMLRLGADDVLVVEGIHALNPKSTYSLPKESCFKIYISALTQLNIDEHNRISTTDTRLLRRIVRDARTRGHSPERSIFLWGNVRKGENENIFPYQDEADAMFNSAIIYELSAIKVFAEPLLFSVSEDSEEYYEAKRLLKFLDYFLGIDVQSVPNNSLMREFIGGGCFDI